MLNKEDFEKVVNELKGKLDETTSALVSEEIIAILSDYSNGYDEYSKSLEEIEKLKGEKEELLKVNGKLYQRIGFESNEKENEEDENTKEEVIDIDEIINEKGEMI